MITVMEYKGDFYPEFQASGNAARFILPFAQEVCRGKGYDIGCNREEWKLPGAIGIDPVMTPGLDANHLPEGLVDYIFSSHCLEHVEDWVRTLDHWIEHLKWEGVLLLYLPHPDQKYWRPWNNTKHRHVLHPETITAYLEEKKFWPVLVSGRDLNHSYAVLASREVQIKQTTNNP
jgi:SAM-dependent methyltransferase